MVQWNRGCIKCRYSIVLANFVLGHENIEVNTSKSQKCWVLIYLHHSKKNPTPVLFSLILFIETHFLCIYRKYVRGRYILQIQNKVVH